MEFPLRTSAAGLALAALGIAAPAAGAIVPVPPPTPPGTAASAAVCPLYWHPGEPAALYPHAAPAGPESRRLAEGSGAAAAREAREWIEVGRSDAALAALAGAPDTPEVRLVRLAALAGEARWAELSAALAATPVTALPAGCGGLRDLWAARAAAGTGDGPAADRAFERLAAAVPGLAAYVDVWRLAAAAGAGDPPRGEAAWARIAASGLPDAVVAEARALLPGLYERAGRPAEAARWHEVLAEETRGETRAGHRLAAARLLEAAGDAAGADRLRARVVAEEPAAAAGIVLDPALRARLGISALDAARVLAKARRWTEAEPFATAALESGAGDGARRDALVLRAGIRAGAGDRAGSEADYAAFLSRWPDDPRAPEVQLDRARLALGAGDGITARTRLANLFARWPSDRRADDALYLLADSWQDDRTRDPAYADSAIAAFDRLVRTRPRSYYADRAEMRAAHLEYALGRWREAARRYAAYGRGPSAREARYWLARTLARLGEGGRARELLAGLAGDDDYYGLLARDRLAGGAGVVDYVRPGDRPGPAPPYGDGAALLAEPAGRRAAALLAFGERAWARAELARMVADAGRDRARLAALAPALAAWGFPGLTLRIGVRLGGEDDPLAYPAGYAAAIDREARVHGLDPWLLLALVRQESLFDATAVSPADARGLVQVLPSTGRELAREAGWRDWDVSVLFVPAVNLHLGAVYLARQADRFHGFWPAVLAAYNGGPEAVATWWDFPERTQDPELWIDRIPYRETREYVRKIVAQSARYEALHGDDAPAR